MPYHTKVTFRFIGPGVFPKDITTKLGVFPTFSGRKGDPILHQPGQTYPASCWGLVISNDSSLDEQLRDLVAALDGKSPVIKSILKDGVRGSILCGCFVNNECGEFITITPETLAAVASIGVPLELDVYSDYEVGRDPLCQYP